MMMWIVFIVLVAMFIGGVLWAGSKLDKEYESSKVEEVTVIAQVVNSPYSKVSYTECIFNYNGERHITDMRPCTAFVGEKLTVNVTPDGEILDQYTKYK